MSSRVMALGAGAAIGYILGSRAGRQRYDEIAGKAKRVWESDTVQEAAGAMQGRAGRLYDEGKKMVSGQADQMSGRHEQGFAERNRKPQETPSPTPASKPAGTMANPTTLPGAHPDRPEPR